MTAPADLMVPVNSLCEHPKNARRGDVNAIAASLERLGQYRPVVVNRGSLTGRPNEILAGHHIVKALRLLGRSDVLVHWVDVDDADGDAILAVDNRASELGDYDTDALYALLDSMPDLTGTGYTSDDMDDLRVLLEQSAQQVVIVDDGPDDAPKPKFDFDPEHWAKNDRRILVIDLPVPVYGWLVDRLTELCQRWDLEANADAVLRLVSEATGQEVPAFEDQHEPDEDDGDE